MQKAAPDVPTILFGAFDRHNFGDLLFPHVVATLLPEKNLVYAGLASRDLRRFGGHRVEAVSRLAAGWGERPANIIHVGGELLTCEAWQAAAMLLAPEQAQAAIAHYGARPQEALAWARSQLGVSGLAPYTLPRRLFPHAGTVLYNAVGGVELGECDSTLRAEVLANLEAADGVAVRDRQTLAVLHAAGIPARLLPDPAVMVAELFGARIRQRVKQGEVAQMLAAFPQAYIAVQFSADFGEDATLSEIAAQLDAMAKDHGIVLFRAGAAPWHDELRCYERVASRMHLRSVRIFSSLDLWDICALIACSRAYCGSSLHGRIVAMAFALPRINLLHPAQAAWRSKQVAYAATWEAPGMPAMIEVHGAAQGIRQAMAADPEQLQKTSRELAAHYRQGFDALCAGPD